MILLLEINEDLGICEGFEISDMALKILEFSNDGIDFAFSCDKAIIENEEVEAPMLSTIQTSEKTFHFVDGSLEHTELRSGEE